MNATANRSNLERQARALANVPVLIETNEGTFGPLECRAVTGTGDTRAGTSKIYELVGGGKRFEGLSPAKAPGVFRRINAAELAAKRSELAELRKLIAMA
jgi:hypothetical protein